MKKSVLGVLTIASLSLFGGSLANAAEVGDTTKENKVQVNVNPGPFDLRAPGALNFAEVKLGDESKELKTGFEGNFNLRDFRGTHEGYTVYATATQFENKDGKKLPEGSLTLSPVKSVDRKLESSLGDKNYPKASQEKVQIIDAQSPVSVLKADKENGMGSFDFEFNQDTLNLVVDSSAALSGSYQSTMTWSLVAAP